MRARKIHGATAVLAVLAGGCDALLGLEHRELYQPDSGGGSTTSTTTTTTSTSSGTGGAGGAGGAGVSASSSSGTGGSGIECVPGQKQCAGDLPQSCDQNGHWQSGAPCDSYCSVGTCIFTPSCASKALTCGLGGDESCCASPVVVGGQFNRSDDPAYPATVSDFRLDRFEITVGRFREFVNGYPGNKPVSGAGVHPKIPGSGWDSAWDGDLPADVTALKKAVKCSATVQTWTDAPDVNEHLPINCIDWYTAFAFCAWDGGRLPTEAEWNYAASGGAEQRQYPWSTPPSSTKIDDAYAVYNGAAIGKVGSKSAKGDGKSGQADLAGGVWEWNLDWWAAVYSMPACADCALVSQGNAALRVLRGGSWNGNNAILFTYVRNDLVPTTHNNGLGARCARTP